MRKPERKSSMTLRLQNALITVHEWTSGTLILHIETTDGHLQRASVWVNHDEVEAVRELLAGMLPFEKATNA